MTQLTDHDLEHALNQLSRIIARYGDAYWPLFEALEAELDHRRKKMARLTQYSGQTKMKGIRSWRNRPAADA